MSGVATSTPRLFLNHATHDFSVPCAVSNFRKKKPRLEKPRRCWLLPVSCRRSEKRLRLPPCWQTCRAVVDRQLLSFVAERQPYWQTYLDVAQRKVQDRRWVVAAPSWLLGGAVRRMNKIFFGVDFLFFDRFFRVHQFCRCDVMMGSTARLTE